MLESVEWGEYRLGNLFGEATRGKRLKSADRVQGDLPFVTAGEADTGVSAFIGNKVDVFAANTITIDMFGSAKYRDYQYGADDHVAVVHTENLPKHAVCFIASAIHKVANAGEFHYGRNFYAKDAKDLMVSLPSSRTGEPDYEFMEKFIAELKALRIAELKALRIAELKAYLTTTGLKDYTLTTEEEQIIKDFEIGNVEWGEFDVTKVFEVCNAGNILANEIVEGSGSTPYLCASRENNAVSSYISYREELITEGNCIFIGGKTFVVTYQECDFFSNDSHNLTLRLYDSEHRTKLKQLYLATCVTKSLGHKYSWGDSVSNRKIQKDKILLPCIHGQVDFSKMETFISAIQKLVIKDIVLYSEKEYAATRRAIQ